MADSGDDDGTVWTLVAAAPEDLNLADGVEHYALDGMVCRYFRANEVGGVDHQPDRVNIHCNRDKRIIKIDIG